MAKTRKEPPPLEGPLIQSLSHRLSRCPREFLLPARIGKSGKILVGAVVSDLMEDAFGKPPDQRGLLVFSKVTDKDGNWLNTVLVACWLLSDEWFKGKTSLANSVINLLGDVLRPLVEVVKADQMVLEPDRREELARICFHALGFRPSGESEKAAADRLNALDSVERHRVMLEAKKAEEHARKVREAMAKKKAREAAAKVMRE